jgi:conjugative relaxase-like TrwC/TraI family protein
MLRIVQSSGSSRAKSYYSTADYYAQGQELAGVWQGKGSAMLGLSGKVDRADWDRLCDNLHPASGEPLTPRHKDERRVGYDFNFHVPKSVSLLYGATHDERVLQAFRASVRDTMLEIEAEAKARVRTQGRNEDRTTGNLVWGEYVHLTSRPVDGVPDPHLHAHCFVFNATFDREEGRWKAAQLGDIKRDAPYFEAVFHSLLARRLEELGLQTVRTATGWELSGLGIGTLDKFSRRTSQIEAEAERLGITDPDAKSQLGAQTRERKAKDLDMPELRSLWLDRLTAEERRSLDAIADRIGREPVQPDDRATRDGVARAMEHAFERNSVVPERTLLAAALKQAVGRGTRSEVERLVAEQPLLRGTRNGRTLVSTAEVLDEERRLLAFAREGRGACRPLAPDRTTFSRDWLNEQQRSAVRHVLGSRDRVILIRGAAGTGKTSMMQETREALEAAGVHVHAFAPSAAASRGVLRAEGFDTADTVARLLVDPAMHAQVKGGVIWVDEAGLLGTRTMADLFELAEEQNARVILSGDRRQHGSVERGAALRLLQDEAGLRPAELKEIQRQRDRYKAAISDLAEGHTDRGFRRLDQLGWIRECDDATRNEQLATAYADSVQAGKSALVVSPTHAEGRAITQAIRTELQQRGLLSGPTHEIQTLEPVSLTIGEKHDPTAYRSGDVLVFHQNARGFRRGQRLRVGSQPVPLDQAERFEVFRPTTIPVMIGDRVRVTRNGTTVGKSDRLNNSDLFTIRGFTPEGHLIARPVEETRQAKDYVIDRDFGHLAPGFVVTSHASQGRTVNRVFIGQSSHSFAASSREQFYVSASRGREQVLVFTDDKEELLRAVDRSDERLTATELAESVDQRRRHVVRSLAELQTPARIPDRTPHQREEVDRDR